MIRRPNGLPTALHSARIHKVDGNQAITAATTAQVVGMTQVTHKRGTAVGTGTANALTVTQSGIYLAAWCTWYSAGTSGEKNTILTVNGTSLRTPNYVGGNGRPAYSDSVLLNAGDVVTLNIYAAAACTLTGWAAGDTALGLTYLGPAA